MWRKHKRLLQTFVLSPSILDNIARNIMAELHKFFPLIDKWPVCVFSGPVKLFISLISRVFNRKNGPRLSLGFIVCSDRDASELHSMEDEQKEINTSLNNELNVIS